MNGISHGSSVDRAGNRRTAPPAALAGQRQLCLGLGSTIPRPRPAMAKIERIILPDIPPPVSHYCHVTRAGPHVWVAGVVGQADDGSIPADVVAQFDIAIAAMDKCLKAAGA